MRHLTPEERRRIVASTKFGQPEKYTGFEAMFKRLEDVIESTERTINPILKAGGGHDKAALRETIFKVLMENLDCFEREELHAILTAVIADRILADVDANPFGNDKPDLLGGQ